MDLPKMIREQTVEFIDSQEIDRKINESVKEVVISSVKHAMRAPLCARFKDLPTSDMKEILLQRMLEENYDKGHADHRAAYKAPQDSICRDECEDFDVDKAQEETKKKSKQDSPKTPPGSPPSPPPPPPPPLGASGASGTTRAFDSAQAPPPPPPSSSTHQVGQSTSTAAPSSSKIAASAEYSAWTTTDTRIKPSITTIPDDLYGYNYMKENISDEHYAKQIDEALDYRVKEFQINRTNPGMNTRFWSKKDVDRSKDFIFAIQKRLKTRRNLLGSMDELGGGGEGSEKRIRLLEGDRMRGNVKDKCGEMKERPLKTLGRKTGSIQFAVRITWLIADIEDKYHGPSDTLHNPP
ncbi:hypothetical protein Tco_0664438 [Tanacetum coccineum]